ncbi:MAG: apolipoprotein N-acyltransferase [Actinobacteria bacterium]|nr:apolipoprotein N-acyltransferase [Actinomycetota bacterium]
MRVAGRRLPVALLPALISGLLTSLAFPPAGIWPLAFVSLVPFLWSLREARPARGLALGLAFGVGFFGAVLYWILLFGGLAWTVLVAASAASIGIVGMLSPIVRRPGRPLVSAAGFAALWVVVDAARGAWPFGGFTWGQLGVSQVSDTALVPLARVTGAWGVTFVVVLVNALVLHALERGRGAPLRGASHVGLAAALVLCPALLPGPAAGGRSIDVAAIQLDVRPFRGLSSTEEDRAVTAALASLHATLAADPPDLVVWGESAIDPGSAEPGFFSDVVVEAIRDVGAPVLAGSIQQSAGGLQNQALAFDGRGDVVGRYAKVHLVPYGEYVPFRPELGWVSALRQIPYDLVPGERVHSLRIDGLPRFATPICFENSFPSIDRNMVNDGAQFLVVLTNDASYETTAASAQQLQMSRMRAIEDGRWVVHGAVSGISAVVNPRGQVVARRGLFDTGILRATMGSSRERTWYVRMGDWFPRSSALFLLGLFLVPRRRRRGATPPGPLPDPARAIVVLPTYNERDTIEWVIEQLLHLPAELDLLVVDDSSPDGTGDLARALAEHEPRVKVLSRPAKSGLASAYLDGFRLALEGGYDLVVEMDSDLSHDPAELPRLLAAAADHDLTVGSRYVPGGSVSNWSRPRVWLSKGGNLYARLLLGIPVRDATSGYRVFRRRLLEEISADPLRSEGYGFQIEAVWRAARAGFDVGEAPITFREREHGVSKISRRIVLEALWLVTLWGLRSRLGLDR